MIRIANTAQRDRIVVIALVTLAVLAFPVLSSLLSAWTPSASAVVADAQTPTVQAPVIASAPSPTVTPTLAPTPSDTSTPTPTAAPPTTAPSTAAPTTVPSPTATLLPRVYVLPFRPVYLGSAPPGASTPFQLYESGSDVFRTVEQRGTYVRLQTLDGLTSFWTAQTNLSAAPPAAPTYDFSMQGRTVQLSGTGYACLHQANVVPPLSPCQPLANFSSATLSARITSGNVSLYLAEIGGRTYYILTDNGL